MKNVAAVLTALMVVLAVGGTAFAGERPVVVELYTSQSCGPCVPADTLLSALTKRPDVVALTFAVNYWDILGWKDTFASEAATVRQKVYATALGRGGVYTPQMIVDGKIDIVGNREDEVNAAVFEAHKKVRGCAAFGDKKDPAPNPCSVPVNLTRGSDGTLSVDIAAGRKIDAVVWLLSVRRAAAVNVGGGENKGRTLHYSNMVRDIRAVGKYYGAAVSLRLSADDLKFVGGDDIVVLLQKNAGGRILGVATLAASPPARRR